MAKSVHAVLREQEEAMQLQIRGKKTSNSPYVES
jgi:hypothetical protein